LRTGRVGLFSFSRAKKMNTPVGAGTDAFNFDLDFKKYSLIND